ncbi:MAG: hypothetical protein RML72_01235, partial [Bacteroidia bacterium]|nr:hypothetical protein [Bacteroidia bacterium]
KPQTPTNKFSFCQGDSLLLEIKEPYKKIIWNYHHQNSSIYVRHAAWYHFEVENAAGCKAQDSIWVQAWPKPPVPEIKRVGNSLEAPSSFIQYAWLEEGSNTVLSTERIFTPSKNGTYLLRVTDEKGCHNTSLPYTFFITSDEEFLQSTLQIDAYPNPFKDELQIELLLPSNYFLDTVPLKVEAYTLEGKKIDEFFLKPIDEKKWANSWKAPAAGQYLLRFKLRNFYPVTKIVAVN